MKLPLRADSKEDPTTPEGCIESLLPFIGGLIALIVAAVLAWS